MLIPGSPTKILVKRIRREFPNLHVQSAKLVQAGWDNVVVDINNELIFRFPRFKAAEVSLQREIKLLKVLKGCFSVLIPDYEYFVPARKKQYIFAGYKKIVGTPLTHDGYCRIWTNNLAKGIARFLRELHSIKITGTITRIILREEAGKMKLYPTVRLPDRLRKIRRQMHNVGDRYLDRQTHRLSEAFFERSIHLLGGAQYKLVLAHCDLTDRNILVNTRTGSPVGILDWSDSMIMDPALDFAGLFEVNRGLGYSTLEKYGNDSEDFLTRVDIYWRLLPYFEILYGHYSNLPRLRIMGAKRLRKRLEEPVL